MKSSSQKILIVENSDGIKRDLIEFFGEFNLEAVAADSISEIKEYFKNEEVAILLLDSDCVDICNKTILQELNKLNDSVYMIIMLTELTKENLVFVINYANNFVNKPFSFHNLKPIIEKGLEFYRKESHYQELKEFQVIFEEWKRSEQATT